MKRVLFSLATLVLAASPSFAQSPGKTMDTTAGKVYADEKGMTLYVFDKDEANKSNCIGDCAKAWPPYMAAADAKAEGEWTIVDRSDGTKMWAYEGKPLYFYADDKKAGDVTGDGKGNVWHVAKVD